MVLWMILVFYNIRKYGQIWFCVSKHLLEGGGFHWFKLFIFSFWRNKNGLGNYWTAFIYCRDVIRIDNGLIKIVPGLQVSRRGCRPCSCWRGSGSRWSRWPRRSLCGMSSSCSGRLQTRAANSKKKNDLNLLLGTVTFLGNGRYWFTVSSYLDTDQIWSLKS